MPDVFYPKQKDYILKLNQMAADLALAFTQVQADWTAVSGPTFIQNKPSFSTVAFSGAYADLTGKPVLAAVATSGLKADVGLGNVDNTSDVNKPVSTATQSALNAKAASATLAGGGGGALIGNTPSGNIVATNTQAAINELDAEKAKLNGDTTQNFNVASLNGGQLAGMRNRIANGNMRINQYAVTSGTLDGTVVSDMWVYSSNLGALVGIYSVTSGSGVTASGGGNITIQCLTAKTTLSSGDYIGFGQNIEGYNVSDFNYGTASAKTGTVSFRASATVAGTVIAVSIRNAVTDRSYVTTVSLSATPSTYNVVIQGDTTGTWLKDNAAGMIVSFYALTGTNLHAPSLNTWNAGNYVSHSSCSNVMSAASRAFSITDVQLEMASSATPYEQRAFSTEMAICQRYYYEVTGSSGQAISTTTLFSMVTLPAMRAAPNVVALTPGLVTNASGTGMTVTNVVSQFPGNQTIGLFITTSGLTAGNAGTLYNARIAFISRP